MRDLTRIFRALSDTNRLRILNMLQVKPLAVCEIREILNLAVSTVSKHLSILRDAGFIIDEKEGRWVNYRLDIPSTNPRINALLPLIQKWISEYPQAQEDRKKAKVVDRHVICG